VAQGKGPEFKLQNRKKNKTKNPQTFRIENFWTMLEKIKGNQSALTHFFPFQTPALGFLIFIRCCNTNRVRNYYSNLGPLTDLWGNWSSELNDLSKVTELITSFLHLLLPLILWALTIDLWYITWVQIISRWLLIVCHVAPSVNPLPGLRNSSH
jgi:hypothetical protein